MSVPHRLFAIEACMAFIERTPDCPVEQQGFGMARIRISKQLRLHYWDDELRVPDVTDIHTHPWVLRSIVLRGYITNEQYNETTPEQLYLQGAQHAQKLPDSGKGVEIAVPEVFQATGFEIEPGPNCRVLRSWPTLIARHRTWDYPAGDTYLEPQGSIHRTVWCKGENPITLLFRVPVSGEADRAYSYSRNGSFVSGAPMGMPADKADIYRSAIYNALAQELAKLT